MQIQTIVFLVSGVDSKDKEEDKAGSSSTEKKAID